MFVIKTHRSPTFFIKLLIRLGISKAVFSYRDPRDVVLSMIDHGNRSRLNLDEPECFQNITDFKSSLKYVKRALKKHVRWQKYGNALFIRYEEFMVDKRNAISSLNHYLEFGLREETIDEILVLHESEKTTYHNYNKGVINRHLTELSEEQQQQCNRIFRNYLLKNEYPVTGSDNN